MLIKNLKIIFIASLLILPINGYGYDWSFAKPWGVYDIKQLQRGFKIYREVCASCHSLRYVSTSDLAALGYDKKTILNWAEETRVIDEKNTYYPINMNLDNFPYFLSNYPGEIVDLSLIAKARENIKKKSLISNNQNSADYIVDFLLGYRDPPKDIKNNKFGYYNIAFSGSNFTAMPDILVDDLVNYEDNVAQTKEQYAKDIAAFLVWASDPHMEKRKILGFWVIVFLVILSIILYIRKIIIWKNVTKSDK
ncbi:cytochrome c1 [Bartonella sp. DGB1]|uniref:cytochrome c1 n=1 Tax=Bartonella sp. DGB1 TaxID=3239807 RepID=UPI003524A75C